MRLYDTMTRSVREVETAHPRLARIYACGPTVYRDAHVGNMRTFLVTDMITRNLRYHGRRTLVVQNITDVGHMADDTGLKSLESTHHEQDKMLVESERTGKTALEIARHFENAFHRDLAALNMYPADHYPRASDSIELMLDLIEKLVTKGHAYQGTDGSVYFSAETFPGYGELSGNRLDQLRPGHRFDVTEESHQPEAKRFHADWALWKVAGDTRTQLTWETPWGRGFPGWHIECSAMSVDLLGDRIDIHTGGIDLRFPHHEDERAQSDSATGKEVVGHWVHAEHLLFESKKMSKSSGNVVLVRDVIARGLDPLALRLTFLQHKYRSQMNLTWEAITAAHELLQRWRGRVATWANSPSTAMDQGYLDRVVAAFNDDLDTPKAVSVLREIEKDESLSDGTKFELFAHLDSLFGLDLARDVGKEVTVPDAVAALLTQREKARAVKDFALSDSLRDQIATLGFTVQDTAAGQELSPN